MKINELEKILSGFTSKARVSETELDGYSIDLINGFKFEVGIPELEDVSKIDALNFYVTNSDFANVMKEVFCDSAGKYSKDSFGHKFSPKKLRSDFSVGCLAMSSTELTNESGWYISNGGVRYELQEFIDCVLSLKDRRSIFQQYISDSFTDFFIAFEGIWVEMFFHAYAGRMPDEIFHSVNELLVDSNRGRTWRVKSEFNLSVVAEFYERFKAVSQ